VESVARRYAVLRPHLNEFQRQLWLGAEAAESGPGGVAVVAKATGVAADTVRRGRGYGAAGPARKPVMVGRLESGGPGWPVVAVSGPRLMPENWLRRLTC
jgi:hypothetical protein